MTAPSRSGEALVWASLAFAVTATAWVIAPYHGATFVDLFSFKFAALAIGASLAATHVLWTPTVRLALHEMAALGLVGVALVSWQLHAPALPYGVVPVALGAAALVVSMSTRIAVERGIVPRHAVANLVLVTAAVVAILALAESAGLSLPWFALRKPQSTMGNRNFVGAYVAAAIPLALPGLADRARTCRSAALVALSAALVLTRCRSAWLGGCASFAVASVWALRGAARAGRGATVRSILQGVAPCAVGVAAAASIPWPGLRWTEAAPLLSTLERLAEYGQGSGKGRIEEHRVAFEIVRSSPMFGAGPHAWADAASAHIHALPRHHAFEWIDGLAPNSDIVRIASETGLLGLLSAFAVAGLLGYAALRRARRRIDEGPDTVAVVGALLCLGVHGLFDAPLYRPETLGLAAVLAGLLPLDVAGRTPRWHSAMAKVMGVVVGAAALALAFAWGGSNEIRRGGGADAMMAAQRWFARPDRQERLVAYLAARGRCKEALAALDQAMRWTPHVWGPLVAAESCASGAERATLHARALAIEPDLEWFFTPEPTVNSHPAHPFVRPPFDDVAFKLWNRFLVRDDGRVVLAVNDAGRFSLYEYSAGSARTPVPGTDDAVDAFLFGDRVIGLIDAKGDNHLVPSDPAVAALIPGGSVERVFGSPDHRGAVVLATADRDLYWIDFATGAALPIARVRRKVEGVTFCNASEIVLAHDGNLVLYDVVRQQTRPLARELAGRKRSPSCHEGEVVFSAEDGADFYGIYRLPNIRSTAPPELLLREEHDLLDAKHHGDFIYYVATIGHEYLLRRLSVGTGRSEALTREGVVYGYEFAGIDTLVYSYRDMRTPASVVSRSLVDGRESVLEEEPGEGVFGVESMPSQDGRSEGFVFHPPAATRPSGSILYFGPRGADVSPRWDPHLMGLLYQGYTIYAPNYPGSVGLGRAYEEAPLSRAVDDMVRWAMFVQSRPAPICYLSVSSGNVVMEGVLQSSSAGVAAASVMFGLPGPPSYRPSVPTLFALGENDPIVPFRARATALHALRDHEVRIVGYPGEGHWLHRREDLDDLLRRIHVTCQSPGVDQALPSLATALPR